MVAMVRAHVLLLTGTPGVGKTTLLLKVAAALASRRLAGFTTEDIRETGHNRDALVEPILRWIDGPPTSGCGSPHRVA